MIPWSTIVTFVTLVIAPRPVFLVWDYPWATNKTFVFQVQRTDDLLDPRSWREYAEIVKSHTNQIWVQLDRTNTQQFFRVFVPSGQ